MSTESQVLIGIILVGCVVLGFLFRWITRSGEETKGSRASGRRRSSFGGALDDLDFGSGDSSSSDSSSSD